MKAIYNFAVTALAVCSLASCHFEEVNTNPNRLLAGDLRASNCFEPILYGLASNSQQYTWYWNNEIVQMTAFTSGATRQEHMYQITGGNWQTIWDVYARYGYDCHHMIELAQQDGDAFLEGVGYILKVYCLYNLVSLFGEIPYDEAYKGSDNQTPEFEPEETVFSKLVRDLDKATEVLAGKPSPLSAGLDGMYSDNAGKWIKFANSLRMRILCRATGADESYWDKIQAMIDNPDVYPVFESNDDNATVKFTGVDPYKSYYGTAKITSTDFTGRRLTELMIKLLTILDTDGNATYQDPRLLIWGTMRGSKWKGTVAGCTEAQKSAADDGAATPNYDVLCREDMDGFLMDYSEILFIYAEGVLKGKLSVGGKTAKELYEAAVTANMEKWSPFADYSSKASVIRDRDLEAFFASAIGSFDKAGQEDSIYESQEELLLSQKWLSLFWVNMEPYNEWRRTEYPQVKIGDGTGANNFELPTRMGYPNYTESTNRAHVNEALARMGGENDMHTALWWSYKKRTGGQHRNPYTPSN